MKIYGYIKCFFASIIFALMISSTNAGDKPFLFNIFTDNAVLQRDVELPIWGWAKPGTSVSVQISDINGVAGSAQTITDDNGRWQVKMGPFQAGGPYTLIAKGQQEFKANNILFGDVWLCSGQSNMEMSVRYSLNGPQEISCANYQNIRLFDVPNSFSIEPKDTLYFGNWLECNPENIGADGKHNFSAVAYFFGKELHKQLGVPIGLIESDWGGTHIESWSSNQSLLSSVNFKPLIEELERQRNGITNPLEYVKTKAVSDWFLLHDNGDPQKQGWQRKNLTADSWALMPLPGYWQEKEGTLNKFNGIVWFRKSVNIPDKWLGKDLVLSLGKVDDVDTTYFNGALVGSDIGGGKIRRYTIPSTIVNENKCEISTRVVDLGGRGGIVGNADEMFLEQSGGGAGDRISLSGDWKYKISGELTWKTPTPWKYIGNFDAPTVLFNTMINPLTPAAIKGVIWYQGEWNSGEPIQYRTLLPMLIKDWRTRFISANESSLPFGVVMLAGYQGEAKEAAKDTGWVLLREAQLMTSQSVPHVGIVSAVDIGEQDVHPKNKQDVGKRLALWAMGAVYGKNIEFSGPIYKSMKKQESSIILTFDHVGSGLVSKDTKALTWFAICGDDHKFVHAQAKIVSRDAVEVFASEVKNPVAVRYAWANNPHTANLYNTEGFPALPFRTDTFQEDYK